MLSENFKNFKNKTNLIEEKLGQEVALIYEQMISETRIKSLNQFQKFYQIINQYYDKE